MRALASGRSSSFAPGGDMGPGVWKLGHEICEATAQFWGLLVPILNEVQWMRPLREGSNEDIPRILEIRDHFWMVFLGTPKGTLIHIEDLFFSERRARHLT